MIHDSSKARIPFPVPTGTLPRRLTRKQAARYKLATTRNDLTTLNAVRLTAQFLN